MTDDVNPEPTAPTPAAEPLAAPGRRPSRRLALIGAVVAVLLIAAVVGVVALMSGGGSDPEQAVKDYDGVFKKADCDGFKDLTTSSFRDELGLATCDKFDANAKDGSIATFRLTVTSSEIDGDTSSVRTSETFTSSTGKQTIKLIYSLVKDDGAWKVNKIAEDKGV